MTPIPIERFCKTFTVEEVPNGADIHILIGNKVTIESRVGFAGGTLSVQLPPFYEGKVYVSIRSKLGTIRREFEQDETAVVIVSDNPNEFVKYDLVEKSEAPTNTARQILMERANDKANSILQKAINSKPASAHWPTKDTFWKEGKAFEDGLKRKRW